MGHAQWIQVRVQAENMTIKIKSAGLNSGKFHKKDDKDSSLSINDINSIEIKPGKEDFISACGSSNAWNGTQGFFDVRDGDFKVGRFEWDCPWDDSDNTFRMVDITDNKSYSLTFSGGNRSSGAIGNITIVCIKS